MIERTNQIRHALQEKLTFLTERATPYRSRRSHLWWILRNTRNYHRFDEGWKSWLRDIAMLFV